MSTSNSVSSFAAEALALIHAPPCLSMAAAEDLSAKTLQLWKSHVNAGFLRYRKTMGDGEGAASLDWHDAYPGTSWFTDDKGVPFLDFLSGFGIFNVGFWKTFDCTADLWFRKECTGPVLPCMGLLKRT